MVSYWVASSGSPGNGCVSTIMVMHAPGQKHGGKAAPRLRNDGQLFVPGSTSQAIEWLMSGYQLATPSVIRVNESGKYPEIVGYAWPDSQLKGSMNRNGLRIVLPIAKGT